MIKFLIISGAISFYFAIVLATYIVATKIDPYRPEADDYGDGDANKFLAFIWPFTIPVYIIYRVFQGLSKMLDMVRENVAEKHE